MRKDDICTPHQQVIHWGFLGCTWGVGKTFLGMVGVVPSQRHALFLTLRKPLLRRVLVYLKCCCVVGGVFLGLVAVCPVAVALWLLAASVRSKFFQIVVLRRLCDCCGSDLALCFTLQWTRSTLYRGQGQETHFIGSRTMQARAGCQV